MRSRSARRSDLISRKIGGLEEPEDWFPPELDLDGFVTGPHSRVAHAAALAVTEHPGEYNPLFICGPTGVGKTHLLHAICGRFRELQGRNAAFLGSEEFLDAFTAAAETKTLELFRERFRDVDLLALDDVHFLGGMEGTQEELFRVLEALVRGRRQVVLSGSVRSGEVKGVVARLRSRFPGRLVAFLSPPELEARLEILRRLAARRGCELTPDVARFIALRSESSVRELEGNLTQVLHTAAALSTPIDLHAASMALDELPLPGRRPPSVPCITVAVAEHYLVKEKDLTGPSRKRNAVLPRQVAMFLCRELTHRSLMDIGSQFGGRDHSTVIHALRRVEDLVRTDQRVKRDLVVLRARILPRS
jgi:chromosomal replication initiator protein